MKKCTKCNKLKELNLFPLKKYKADSWCKDCHQEATAIFKRTKIGVIGEIYNRQKANSKTRGHPQPEYTKKTLEEWVMAQDLYHDIFSKWCEYGYLKIMKPSIDRVDDFKHYTLDNIQLMTWGENKRKQTQDILNGVGTSGLRCKAVTQYDKNKHIVSKYISVSQAARECSLSSSHISAVCRGERKTHGGFLWEYNGT